MFIFIFKLNILFVAAFLFLFFSFVFNGTPQFDTAKEISSGTLNMTSHFNNRIFKQSEHDLCRVRFEILRRKILFLHLKILNRH